MCSFHHSDERRGRRCEQASGTESSPDWPSSRTEVRVAQSFGRIFGAGLLLADLRSTCFVNVVRAKLNGLQAAWPSEAGSVM